MWKAGVGLLFIPPPNLCALCFLSFLFKGSTLTSPLPSARAGVWQSHPRQHHPRQTGEQQRLDLGDIQKQAVRIRWGWGTSTRARIWLSFLDEDGALGLDILQKNRF